MRSNTRQKESPGWATVYRRREDVEVHRLDDEAVLYDPRHGAVHRFNAATMRIWDACGHPVGVNGVAEIVAETWSVTSAEALPHVRRLIAELSLRDLMDEVRDTSVGPPTASGHLAGTRQP